MVAPSPNFSSYTNPRNPAQNRVTIAGGVNPNNVNGAEYIKSANYAYMGPKVDARTGQPIKGTSILAPVNDASISWMMLDQQGQAKLRSIMDMYYGAGKWNVSYINKLYGRAARLSAYAYSNGVENNRYITPLDAFEGVAQMDVGYTGGKGAGGAGGTGGGGGPVTSVNRTVSLTDPGSARRLVNDALAKYLGRAATQEEEAAFRKALTAQERKNPTVTTSTSTKAGGGTMTSTVSKGGFNPSTFAEDYAAGQQGAGEYQAATTYLDAFIGALKEVV